MGNIAGGLRLSRLSISTNVNIHFNDVQSSFEYACSLARSYQTRFRITQAIEATQEPPSSTTYCSTRPYAKRVVLMIGGPCPSFAHNVRRGPVGVRALRSSRLAFRQASLSNPWNCRAEPTGGASVQAIVVYINLVGHLFIRWPSTGMCDNIWSVDMHIHSLKPPICGGHAQSRLAASSSAHSGSVDVVVLCWLIRVARSPFQLLKPQRMGIEHLEDREKSLESSESASGPIARLQKSATLVLLRSL